MKFLKLFICIVIFHSFKIYCFAQKDSDRVELSTFLRLDSYPKFMYSTNPTTSNILKIKGTSIGIDLSHSFSLKKKWNIKPGIGYYRHSFTKMEQINSVFGKSNARIIDGYIPPGPIVPALMYATDSYWYNTIAISMGISKSFILKKNYIASLGGEIRNYFTYSQLFNITTSPNGTKYKTNKSRYFGYSCLFSATLQKRIGKINIGPTLLIPVYDLWKQDENFPQENNSNSRNKLFKGFGFGFTLSYPLKQKK